MRGRYSCGHLRMPGIREPSLGCAPMMRSAGFFYFRNFDTPVMSSVFVVLTVVGVVLYKGMEVLEKTLFAWRYVKRGD